MQCFNPSLTHSAFADLCPAASPWAQGCVRGGGANLALLVDVGKDLGIGAVVVVTVLKCGHLEMVERSDVSGLQCFESGPAFAVSAGQVECPALLHKQCPGAAWGLLQDGAV